MFVVVWSAGAVGANAQVYYSDYFTTVNAANWTSNGVVTPTSSGLTSAATNGGSAISTLAVPDGTNNYEVKTYLYMTASGGNYIQYLRATSDSLVGPVTSGSYYAVELANPTMSGTTGSGTLNVYKRVSGTLTLLNTQVVACMHGMPLHSIMRGTQLQVYVNGYLKVTLTDTALATGKPGVGARAMPSGPTLFLTELRQTDSVAPGAVNPQSISTSVQPNAVDFQWQGAVDNPGGSGLLHYRVLRNGSFFGNFTTAGFTDATVAASTNYSYQIITVDIAGNEAAPASVQVTTPPTGSIDPRRVGVRPTGSYWGALGEQIDLMSGNLNYTMPVVSPQGRGGWSVPLALSYNGQLWRKDPGGVWKLGRDVGYGFGWRLQAGSLKAFWVAGYNLHHYLFTDATGGEYRLDVYQNGVWKSREGVRMVYDPATQRLYFPNGTFWSMTTISAGTEEDAGTLYPAIMQDSNGNQIRIRYTAGRDAPWGDSCGRIWEIEDVRAVATPDGTRYRSYTFGYTSETFPHLASITNHIGTSETYNFTYQASQALASPFAPPISYGTAHRLQQVSNTLGENYVFQYLGNQSGELEKVTLPMGGSLRWSYQDFTFIGTRTLREVQTRYLKPSATGAETTHQFNRDAYDVNYSNHVILSLVDSVGAQKYYAFFAALGDARMGLLGWFEERTATAVALRRHDYTWTQDAEGHWYLHVDQVTLDPGTPQQKVMRTAQWLGSYGNVTQRAVYDYPDPFSAVRTWNYTYLSGSPYDARHIRDRLLTATITDASGTRQLVSNYYDEQTQTLLPGPNVRQFDLAAFNPNDTKKGNRTRSLSPGKTLLWSYDGTGTPYSSSDGVGHAVAAISDSSKNYAVPQTLTPNGQGNLATSFSYTGALAPSTVTGPNAAAQQFVYDSYGRPQTSANPHGGVTGYAYTYGPHTTTVTFGVRFTRTTLDGVGRTIKVETGVSGNPAESVVDTEYEPCACSPLGKVKRVSQPHAPAQTPVWTTFTYDALGRTTRVDLPDGSFTTTSYLANVTTVTDPAGKWKKYTNDALGNLTKVQEPNPAGGADLETAYVYDYLDRLKTVTQIRSGTTQTRTFTYDSLERLQSVSHPESGATSYTYNSDRTVASKTDAKGQKVEYGYDGFQRVIQIKRFPTPPTEDLCQRTLLYYDVNPFNPGDTSGKRWGRLAATQWFVPANGTCAGGGHRFTELYDYTVGGLAAKKRLYVKLNDTTWPNALADLGVLRELNYSYDGSGLGLLVGMTYPSGTGQQLTYVYDSLQRPVQVNNTGANPLVQGITYGPGNEMKTLQHLGWVAGSTGNYYAEQRQYNNRLQLTRITGNFIPPAYATPANGIDLEYRYTTAQNNGQISQQKDWVSGEEVTYQYDSLSRLISAATTGPEWGLSFAYDGFGNRTNQTVTKGSGPSSALTYNSLNRINGFNYDNNGNITWMSSGVTLTYDAENRSTTMQGGFGTERYGYDPRNQRVYRKKADGTEEFTLWGAGSQRIETFRIVSGAAQTQTTNIYFAGRLMRTKNHTTGNETALVTDRVGSVAVRVNPSGTNEKLRYYPYGEEYTATTNDRDKFATYSRDSSTGLDYAMNRYYGSNIGRFTTPDPSRRFNPGDPRSFNQYSYTGGDPTNATDRNGLYWELLGCEDAGYLDAESEMSGRQWRNCYYTSVEEFDTALFQPPRIRRGGGGSRFSQAQLVQGAADLIDKEDCGNFLVGVGQKAFLTIAGKSNPGELDPSSRAYYDAITGDNIKTRLNNASFTDERRSETDKYGNTVSARADYGTDGKGQSVTLFNAFFNYGTRNRNQTVVHEGMHLIFAFGDSDLAKAAGVYNGDDSASSDFHKELQKNCK